MNLEYFKTTMRTFFAGQSAVLFFTNEANNHFAGFSFGIGCTISGNLSS